MLQFMLATAWEMERRGHSGVRAFIMVRDLGLRLGQLEETWRKCSGQTEQFETQSGGQ